MICSRHAAAERERERTKERKRGRRERELNIEISISSSEQLNADRISRENGHHAGGGCSGCAPQLLQFVSTLSTHPICICSFLPNFLAKQGHALASVEGMDRWRTRARGPRERGWNEPESQERQRNDSLLDAGRFTKGRTSQGVSSPCASEFS